MIVRRAAAADHDAIKRILTPIIGAGETYALPREWNEEEILAYWFSPGHDVFVADDGGEILGTYYLQANQRGGGAHVANCGYVTAPAAMGRGVARAMATHSLAHAKQAGYLAMQFNFVVSSNERAVRLWEQLGFVTVGRIPAAFRHPQRGLVDALVMHRFL